MQKTSQARPAQQAAKPEPPTPPAEFQEGGIAGMDAAGLVKILTDTGSSEFQKAKACQRIGEIGAKEAVPALAALLADQHLNTYARNGLETIDDASAGEALRSAMPRLKGDLLIGVINSIGKRRDSLAAPALTKLIYSANAEVAGAAAMALGAIGDESAMNVLLSALAKTKSPTREAVADAGLLCADHLLVEGRRPQAIALYTSLSASGIPKPARLGAMAAIIREETSVGRPR